MSISDVLETKVDLGSNYNLIFSRVLVSIVDLDFSVVAACYSRSHFWVQRNKI